MKLNFYNSMFMFILMLSVIISLSSNNMLMIWVGMEISFMCFMPMMSKSSKIMSHSSIKYYMIQSISSLIMILGMMIVNTSSLSISIISISIVIKLALSPFHSWIIIIIEQMDIWLMLMLLVIMKTPPINIACMIKLKLEMICIISMIVGCMMTLNQTSIRKIIAYSSVFNMGMMTSTLNFNQSWIIFMVIYMLNLMIIFKLMKKVKMNFVNQCLMNEQNVQSKINFPINLMSMGGMPPMMGFVMKILIIEKLMEFKMILMLITISMFSVVMMFVYIRLSFLMIMFSCISMKWIMLKTSKMSMFYVLINLLSFPALMCSKTLM